MVYRRIYYLILMIDWIIYFALIKFKYKKSRLFTFLEKIIKQVESCIPKTIIKDYKLNWIRITLIIYYNFNYTNSF